MRLTQTGFALGAGIFNTYEIVPSALSINEGEALTVEVRTTGISSGTALFWTINNITSTNADFVSASGSFTTTSGVGTFNISLSADALTEGPESFSISIRRGSTSGLVVATSVAIAINDTSLTPSYAITPSVTTVNEGQSVSFTVDTINVPSGTVLHWTTQSLTGTVATGDFTDNLTSGTITINNNTASITRTLREDLAIDGSESFAIQIRTGSASGPVVVTSATVTINDTSVPTYSVTPDVGSVNEGGSVTFTVNTQGVANGTTLYWSATSVSGTINSNDFSDSAVAGSFTINSNTGSFTRTLSNDATTEGTETFAIQIRTGSTSGTVVATSSSITINDTSLNPTYSITPNATSVNEGGSVTFTVTTTNVANGTTLFWTTQSVTGSINTGDFTDGVTTGSVTINTNTGSVVRQLTVSDSSEGTESFRILLRIGSISGTIVATSADVTIGDISATVTPNATSVNEGGSVTFTVNTVNIPSGSTLAWSTQVWSGTINADDFTDGVLTGTVTVNNNTASIVRSIRSDLATEGSEQFRIVVSFNGQGIGSSDIITINDTSLTPPGQVLFTSSTFGFNTQTTSTWTVPAGVTRISVLCIGGGGGGRSYTTGPNLGGGGGGGGIAYISDFAVTPGASVTVRVGNGGQALQTDASNSNAAGGGGTSEIVIGGTIRCQATGGSGGSSMSTVGGAAGNGIVGSVFGRGGAGGRTDGGTANSLGGGGGAGGFQGFTGGQGAHSRNSSDIRDATAGAGGGGGGGGRKSWIVANGRAGHGGGIGVLGQTTNGAPGANNLTTGTAAPAGDGGVGSGGSGKLYGGGGGGGYNMTTIADLNGGSGAVRIMWPGNLRSYPSTRTANE